MEFANTCNITIINYIGPREDRRYISRHLGFFHFRFGRIAFAFVLMYYNIKKIQKIQKTVMCSLCARSWLRSENDALPLVWTESCGVRRRSSRSSSHGRRPLQNLRLFVQRYKRWSICIYYGLLGVPYTGGRQRVLHLSLSLLAIIVGFCTENFARIIRYCCYLYVHFCYDFWSR